MEINAHYSGYLEKQEADIIAFRKDESLIIPENIDYLKISGLSNEVKSKFILIRPKTLGQARSHIANFLRLLNLPEAVLKLIETQKLSAGHAKILVGLDNAEFVANKIVEKNLSVRQSENFVKIFKTKKHLLNIQGY